MSDAIAAGLMQAITFSLNSGFQSGWSSALTLIKTGHPVIPLQLLGVFFEDFTGIESSMSPHYTLYITSEYFIES